MLFIHKGCPSHVPSVWSHNHPSLGLRQRTWWIIRESQRSPQVNWSGNRLHGRRNTRHISFPLGVYVYILNTRDGWRNRRWIDNLRIHLKSQTQTSDSSCHGRRFSSRPLHKKDQAAYSLFAPSALLASLLCDERIASTKLCPCPLGKPNGDQRCTPTTDDH